MPWEVKLASSETMLVVGAGQTAAWAVGTYRQQGFSGNIVLVGDERHLPYERPPLSKGVLAGSKTFEQCLFKPEEFYRSNRIELRLGNRASHLDCRNRTVTLSTGEMLHYQKLLIATGARVRGIKVKGAHVPGVFYLRTVDDAMALRPRLRDGTRLVLVGGGYIGLEVAATARALGCAVCVIEAQSRIMARVLPEVVSAYLRRVHEDRGVKIHTGISVLNLDSDKDGISVHCSGGRSFAADLVVVGLGVQPNVELAQAAGIETADGIVVDACGQTSEANVFAAGDVACRFNPLLGRHVRIESWQNAQNQGVAVARCMCGERGGYAEIPWFWSDQYELNIQILGFPEVGEQIIVRGAIGEEKFVVLSLANRMLIGVVSVNNPRDLRLAKKLMVERQSLDPARLANPAIPLA